jgi:hypothetical protein
MGSTAAQATPHTGVPEAQGAMPSVDPEVSAAVYAAGSPILKREGNSYSRDYSLRRSGLEPFADRVWVWILGKAHFVVALRLVRTGWVTRSGRYKETTSST